MACDKYGIQTAAEPQLASGEQFEWKSLLFYDGSCSMLPTLLLLFRVFYFMSFSPFHTDFYLFVCAFLARHIYRYTHHTHTHTCHMQHAGERYGWRRKVKCFSRSLSSCIFSFLACAMRCVFVCLRDTKLYETIIINRETNQPKPK